MNTEELNSKDTDSELKKRKSFGAISPISKSAPSPEVHRRFRSRFGSDPSIILNQCTPERLVRSFSSQYMEVSIDNKNNVMENSYDEMQVSQSSCHPSTPLRSFSRSVNRKNLSRSFSLFYDEKNKRKSIVKLKNADESFSDEMIKINSEQTMNEEDVSMRSELHDLLICSTPSKKL